MKNGGTFTGYASGFLQTGKNGTGQPDLLLKGKASVVLDPEGNTVTANITADHITIDSDHVKLGPYVTINTENKTTTSYNLGFLGKGDVAYVDDDTFLAVGDDGSTSIVRTNSKYGELIVGPVKFTYRPPDQIVNFQKVIHTGGFASVPNAPLCQQCDFLKYGFWASDVAYGAPDQRQIDKMGGWWVTSAADAIATAEQLADPDNFLATDPTATYAGTAVGDVANNLDGQGWLRYEATGGLNMNWNFAERSGDLTISHFDTEHIAGGGLTFSGPMCAPGVVCGPNGHQFTTPQDNNFGGPLALTNGAQISSDLSQKLNNLSGFATGSFVAGPANFTANKF